MNGKVYKFKNPKTGEIEYVREDNLGFAGEKSLEDYIKKYGVPTKKGKLKRDHFQKQIYQ